MNITKTIEAATKGYSVNLVCTLKGSFTREAISLIGKTEEEITAIIASAKAKYARVYLKNNFIHAGIAQL